MGKNEMIIIPILIITCSLLNIPFAFPIIQDTELGHVCAISNLPFNNNYNQGRALVAMDITINTASNDGFRTASFAWPDASERSYGLALCRGDVSAKECKSCVSNVANTLNSTTRCPSSRSAILWRDYCLFKYSDVDFLGTIDIVNSVRLMNEDSWVLTSSREVTIALLVGVSNIAINNKSTKFYANGMATLPWLDDTKYADVGSVYGMAQCTRDLTPDGCRKCLDVTLEMVSALKKGEHVVYGSCTLIYETYDFIDN